MKRSLVFAVLVAATAPTFAAEPNLTGKPSEIAAFLEPKVKTTTLTGEAEIKVPVEKAVASLRVVSENRSFAAALNENNGVRAKVAAVLKNAGLPDDQVQGAKFSSTPSYSVFSDKAKSYRVENLVRVTVKDDKQFLAVASAVDAFPEVHFAGIEPEPGDATAHKEKALAAALKNAADRKALLEQSTGLVLKPDSVGNISVHLAVPEAIRGRYASKSFAGEQGLGSLAYTPDASPLAGGLGEVKITATVSITYTVSPKQ
jgi:uncharacterized protein YggE